MAAHGSQVAIAWYAQSKTLGDVVQLLVSRDQGRTFDDHRVLDNRQPLGRVAVGCLDDGATVVCWLSADGERAQLNVCRAQPGEELQTCAVTTLPASRDTGFPRLATLGRDTLVTWTVPAGGASGSSPSIRVARVRFAAGR